MREAFSLAEEYDLPVFPCKPDKKPYTEHGFHDASKSIDQIEVWWHIYTDALIGIPTGAASHILVVDIDPEGEDWYAEHIEELAATRVHQTKRGHHLLYKMPALDIRNSASLLAPGVDVRAEGGYIIWWPAHGLWRRAEGVFPKLRRACAHCPVLGPIPRQRWRRLPLGHGQWWWTPMSSG